KGLFDVTTLERWLEKQQLNSADLPLFLEMMQQCGTCFKLNQTHFIAPDNLPEFDNNQAIQTWHDAEPDIEIELSYSFLHDATMRYLLSKIGEVAKEHAYYWRYGCCFYDQKHKTKVWFECRLQPVNADHLQNYSQPGVIRLRFAGQQCVSLAQHLVESITQSSHLGQLPEVKWLKGQPVKNTDDKVEHDSPKPFSAIGPAALPPKTPAIYFSYAWGTEQDPRQKVCDEVYQSLKTEGYLVQRDKEATDIGASIAEFERSIGRGDFVLVVLSHKYLFESLHCMKELAFLYESIQRQQPEFTHRIIPVLLSDVRIDRPVDRLKIAKYWHEQHTELNNLVNEVGAEVAGASSALELEQMRSVVNCCVNALAWISDLITERQSELLVDATVTLVKTKVALWAEKH
uniref:TIR domain-containing protein n=1 Tax=Rheinheimera faecalis TaxID=2901141 RepID=UPI001E5EFB72